MSDDGIIDWFVVAQQRLWAYQMKVAEIKELKTRHKFDITQWHNETQHLHAKICEIRKLHRSVLKELRPKRKPKRSNKKPSR